MRAACAVVIIAVAGTAHADVKLSEPALQRETTMALAAVKLGSALQTDDRKALDAATRSTSDALASLQAYLDAHPKERTPEVARIVTAADKLVKTADHLRALLDQKADGNQIHIVAIDALHRYNELIDAHQGDPPRKEIPYPDELIERFVKTLERRAREAQQYRTDCKKLGGALAAHADADFAVFDALHKIDDARPQDQREAERDVVRAPKLVARFRKALDDQAPMFACKADPGVAAYLNRMEP